MDEREDTLEAACFSTSSPFLTETPPRAVGGASRCNANMDDPLIDK